jgi:hypothetical protein
VVPPSIGEKAGPAKGSGDGARSAIQPEENLSKNTIYILRASGTRITMVKKTYSLEFPAGGGLR